MAQVQTQRWDPELQMFMEDPHDLDLEHLKFLRYLAEHGRLEHQTEHQTPIEPGTN